MAVKIHWDEVHHDEGGYFVVVTGISQTNFEGNLYVKGLTEARTLGLYEEMRLAEVKEKTSAQADELGKVEEKFDREVVYVKELISSLDSRLSRVETLLKLISNQFRSVL